MGSVVWFAINTALAAALSFIAATCAFGNQRPVKVLLGTLAGFPIVTTGCVILTGALGILSTAWISILLASTTVVLLLVPDVRLSLRSGSLRLSPLLLTDRPLDPILKGLAIAVVLNFAAIPMLRPIVAGPNPGFDDLSYHAASIADWLAQGRLVLSPSDYHAYYPFNAEAFGAWFILPFHSDGLVGLSGAFWVALLWIATSVLVIMRSRSLFLGMITATLVVATPIVGSLAWRFSSPDLSAVAMAVCALALFLPDEPKPNNSWDASELYAGLLLGFSLGCKVSFGIAIAVILSWLLLSSHAPWSSRKRWKRAGAFFAGVVCTGGFWYARNWIITGNPLFPAQFGPFMGPFGPDDQARTKLIAWILARPTDMAQWGEIVRPLVDWPQSLFGVSMLGYLVTGVAFFRHRADKPRGSFENLLLILGLISVCAFMFMPFSATDNDFHGALQPKTRFNLLPFALGLILFALLLFPRKEKNPWPLAAMAMGLITAWDGNLKASIALLTLVPIAYWLWDRYAGRVKHFLPNKLSGSITVLVLLVAGVALIRPFAEKKAAQRLFEYGSPEQPIGKAWQALEVLPQGTRVACFTNAYVGSYPLHGRNLTRIPVSLDPAGCQLQPLHILYAGKTGASPWWGAEASPDPSTFLTNLRQASVQAVLVSKWGGDAWPPQQEYLNTSALFVPLYEDGFSTIWQWKGKDLEHPGL